MVKRLSALALTLAALILVGCGGSSSTLSTDPRILFINASPDAGTVDFKLDDVNSKTALVFSQTDSQFARIEFRGEDVQGWDVSLHQNSNGAEIDREAIVFGQDTDNIVIAHGLLNFGTEQLKRLRFSNFTANLQKPNGNRAKLIIFHAAERATGLDTPQVTFKTPGDNAQFVASPIGPGESTTLNTDSGTLNFEARRTGTDGILGSGSQTLNPGGVYLVLIAGLENDPTRPISINFIELPGTL